MVINLIENLRELNEMKYVKTLSRAAINCNYLLVYKHIKLQYDKFALFGIKTYVLLANHLAQMIPFISLSL
jgi:hypothetical protein